MSWFDQHGRKFAWRTTTDPYAILMAEMMLQRTKAAQAERVWLAFLEAFPTLEAARRASDEQLGAVLRPLGLNWRIRNIIRVVRNLERIDSPDCLERVPGVGHYVVSAVRCFAFAERVAIVDANVVRFYSELFDFPVDDRTRRDPAFHAFAGSMVPAERFREYNWAILDAVAERAVSQVKDCLRSRRVGDRRG